MYLTSLVDLCKVSKYNSKALYFRIVYHFLMAYKETIVLKLLGLNRKVVMVMNPEVSPLRHKFFIVQASHIALFYVISWHIVWVWCVLMMDRQEGDCPCGYKGSHSVCRPGGDRSLDAL